jgi:hypothetical protein
MVHNTGERWYEAELYRLRGELTLAQSNVQRLASRVQTKQEVEGKGQTLKIPHTQHPTPSTQAEAEAYFHKAIAIARQREQSH